jgi:membrane glycosyltransferase
LSIPKGFLLRDKSLIEIPRIPSPPKFLIRMEERAEARKQRMKLTNEIRQRRFEEQKKKDEINRQIIEEKERQEQIQVSIERGNQNFNCAIECGIDHSM